MMPAIYDTVSADISWEARGLFLERPGSIMKFPGFFAVYEEKKDEEEKEEENRMLPHIQGRTIAHLLRSLQPSNPLHAPLLATQKPH